MKESKKRSLKLGVLVVVGLILFSLAIYYMGSQQNLFSSTITINSYFNNVNGLVEGNKVRYSGITVGYVSHIEIIEDTTILVEMSVDKEIGRFIRKDSRVEITSDGLMGSKILNIHPGSSEANKIKDNDTIVPQHSPDFQEVLDEAQKIIELGNQTMNNLLEISNKINNGEGDLARLLNDNTITSKLNQAGNEVLAVVKTSNEIVEKINRGEGDMGRLVNDTVITAEVNRIMGNVNNVTSATDSIADELLQFSTRLNEGSGLINRLVYDTEMADKIDTTLANANRGIEQASKAARTIEKSWLINLFSGNKKNEQ